MQRPVFGLACALLFGVAGAGLAMSGLAACGGGEAEPDAGPPDAEIGDGTLSLSWSLRDGDRVLSCEEVGALSVSIMAIPTAGGFGVPEVFPCQAGSSTSTPIREGTYNVQILLRAGSNQELTEPVVLQDVPIAAARDTILEPMVFEVVPRGTLAFRIETDAAGNNCDPQSSDGGGITEMLLEIRDDAGACVPVTIEIAAGDSQPASTYEADCTGTRHACIEKDQLVHVYGVPSGQRSMLMRGYKGEERCYERIPLFMVVGNDLVTELLPQRMTLDPAPACEP